MNVIVSNKNQSMLENLGIDIIKEMNGEFDVEEIIATFQNFFYQRMILDITAIRNYKDITNLQKLSMALDMEKVILLLDGTQDTSNPMFLSNLVSMGIYNFTKNLEGIQYLYNTPNSYRDVAQFHRLDQNVQVERPIQQAPVQQAVTPPVQYIAPIQSEQTRQDFYGTRIIGVKNITKQSGATSLVYMMHKQLSKNYRSIAIEVDKSDFAYFNDNSLVSTVTNDVGSIINRNADKEVIIIDINNSIVAEGFCQDVIYLIEPSIIKLQKLVTLNAAALQGLRSRKIVLNQSLLSHNDVANFEYESRIKVFYNLPPQNERSKDLPEINKLLYKLGFTKQEYDM